MTTRTIASDRTSKFGATPALPPLACPDCMKQVPAAWLFSCTRCAGQLVPTGRPALEAGLAAGGTPLLSVTLHGAPLWLKDEGRNPTGSFKDRAVGMAAAAAQAMGASGVCMYSCGNGGAAAAAAAARLGLRCLVLALPSISDVAAHLIRAYGATLVPLAVDHRTLWSSGLVGQLQDALWQEGGWFPLNRIALPLRASPYYLAGCASLADELLADLGQPPRTVVVPAGSGDLLLGLWLALRSAPLPPAMVAAQAVGAAPLVRAWQRGERQVATLDCAQTVAAGIEMITGSNDALAALYTSGGRAAAVSDDAILLTQATLAREHGIFTSPEGAAAVAVAAGLDETQAQSRAVVAVLTASAMKYLDHRWPAEDGPPAPIDARAVLGRAGRADAHV